MTIRARKEFLNTHVRILHVVVTQGTASTRVVSAVSQLNRTSAFKAATTVILLKIICYYEWFKC